ncbi:MAG: TRAP transporter small permease [Clostridia bacterium]|nr:TRAP transporter small permease [Clostridia bacterium]MDH7573537.1 TRAP transporter small permease [Clostridia bacterium]
MADRSLPRVGRFIDRLTQVMLAASALSGVALAVVVTYGVFMRYVLRTAEPYSAELSAIILLFLALLAIPGVEALGRHVQNDMLSSHFPPRASTLVLQVLAPLVALLFVAVLIWKSTGNALYSLKIGQISASAWAVPLGPIKLIIPVGYIVLCLVIVQKLWRGVIGLTGRSSRDR